mmetsp:Transcript_66274/g.138407  ORF Transcript_66274/g.138407 Transcript_66274/m.138407 type:complete len:221 (-) Transcript_66274:372-1034(-)
MAEAVAVAADVALAWVVVVAETIAVDVALALAWVAVAMDVALAWVDVAVDVALARVVVAETIAVAVDVALAWVASGVAVAVDVAVALVPEVIAVETPRDTVVVGDVHASPEVRSLLPIKARPGAGVLGADWIDGGVQSDRGDHVLGELISPSLHAGRTGRGEGRQATGPTWIFVSTIVVPLRTYHFRRWHGLEGLCVGIGRGGVRLVNGFDALIHLDFNF